MKKYLLFLLILLSLPLVMAKVDLDCTSNSCTFSGCENGLIIITNHDGSPLEYPIVRSTKKTVDFDTKTSGEVKVMLVCFKPKVSVEKEVVPVGRGVSFNLAMSAGESPEPTETVIQLGDNLPLEVDTYMTSNPGDIKFYVMKKLPETTRSRSRRERFGFAGAQGMWDQMTYNLYNIHYFGENTDLYKTGEENLEKHFAMLNAIGVKWIGLDFAWEWIIRSPGNWNFDRSDKVFEMARKYDIHMIPMFTKTPVWANVENLETDCGCQNREYRACEGPGNPRCCWSYTTDSGCGYLGRACRPISRGSCCIPPDLTSSGSAGYNEYVSGMVRRYKPNGEFDPTSDYGIENWVIWNEPDWIFWKDCKNGGSQGNLRKYCQLLKGAYQTIKNEDPDAKVAFGGITQLNPTKIGTEIYAHCPDDFDVLNVHNYIGADSMASTVDYVAKVRDENGDNSKEIWMTEMGCTGPCDPTKSNPVPKKNALVERFNRMDPLDSKGLTKILWWDSRGYFFGDGSLWPWERKAALIDTNFYPDDAYFVFGEWMGTIERTCTRIPSSVSGGKININIPSSCFDERGEYTVFYASKSKMVTDLPMKVRVLGPGETTTTTLPPGYQINLKEGFNSIGLPLETHVPFIAETLLTTINDQGGDCDEIGRWMKDDDSWEYHNLGASYNNFDIELGEGYLVECNSDSTFTVTGNGVSSITIELMPTWSYISFPFAPAFSKAEKMLQSINSQDGDCTEVHRLNNAGEWVGHNLGSSQNNFNINRGEGYLVKCSKTSQFDPSLEAPTTTTTTLGSTTTTTSGSTSTTIQSITTTTSGSSTSTTTQTTTTTVLGSYPAPFAQWKFDEGSGQTAGDSIGSRNGKRGSTNSADSNDPAWKTGSNCKLGKCLNFDGSNDYVRLGTFSITGNKLTIIAWFKADQFSMDPRLVSKATGTAVNDHYWMLGLDDLTSSNAELRFRLKTSSGGTTNLEGGSVNNGQWVCAAATYDGNRMRLFKNGNLVTSTLKSGNLVTSSANVWIGSNPPSATSRPFDGVIDEVAIWNKALTSSEITEYCGDSQPSTTTTTGSTSTTTSVQSTTTTAPSAPIENNLIKNYDFESNTNFWYLYSDRGGSLTSESPGYQSSKSAHIRILERGENVQFYQIGVPLQPNKDYTFSFAAKSNRGQDLSVRIHKHSANYNLYSGDLDYKEFDIGKSWRTFSHGFRTYSNAASDARLRFWFKPYVTGGDEYWIDRVVIAPD